MGESFSSDSESYSAGRSKKGLMLVEDPEDTIRAMCSFAGGTLELSSFKSAYEKIKKRKKPIHEKNAHTHFYSLSVYGLIAPIQKGEKALYEISSVGQELCESLSLGNIERFQQMLSNILLNNLSKGHLYKKFLTFVDRQEKISRKEIYKNFKELPGRTLIAWSKAAGLVEANREFVWSLPRRKKEHLTLEAFQKELLEAYVTLSRSDVVGIRKVFVAIQQIREKICVNRSLSYKEFDEYLTRTLNSSFGEKIRLYGGPSSAFKEGESFMYRNKLYLYIRVKV
jgi:hypothetical protein